MKFNTLLVAAICAGSLMTSCVHETAKKNQLKYTHTSVVDGDAFAYFHIIGETLQNGIKHAESAENSGEANSVEIASKVKAYYTQLMPVLDSLATANQVDFPIKGVPYEEEVADTTAQDSTAHIAHVSHAHSDYVHQAQHEVATIKDRLTRLTHNTDKGIQDFAKKQLEIITELYSQIGGK